MGFTVEELDERSVSVDAEGNRSYERSYRIIADDKLYGPVSILAAFHTATSIAIGTSWIEGQALTPTYAYDTGSFCSGIAAKCETGHDGKQWIVTASYSARDPDQLTPDDPTDASITVEWGTWSREKIVDKTTDNKKLVNSAGDPFLDGYAISETLPLLRVTRNELSFDPIVAQQYRGAINSNQWVVDGITIEAKQARVESIEGTPKYHSVIGRFFQVVYEYAIDPSTWVVEILDAGMNQLDADGNLVAIMTDDTPPQPVTDAKLLDGSGGLLAKDTDTVVQDPVYLSFNVHPEKDFSAFNFPTGS